MTQPPIYRRAVFRLSARTLNQLPPDCGWEVAFAGRSNAGKSSALNVITGQKSLARTSKTPGRTQMINLFDLDTERRLVDLPGYGFAKVPEAVRREWGRATERYLTHRRCLRGLILLMDVRHPLTDLDLQLLDWCELRLLPSHTLLTKVDKLSRGKAGAVLQKLQNRYARSYRCATAQSFSALDGRGTEAAWSVLNDWFQLAEMPPLDRHSG